MAVNFGPKFVTSNGLVLQLIPSDPTNYLLDEVEYLVVAGGGGGGSADQNTSGTAAGGGAGGFLTGILRVNPSTAYTVTVGQGGAGGAATQSANGSNGQNSVFGPIVAIGGGYGGSCPSPAGNSGGSGGGASGCGSGPGSGTPGQGFPGGSSNISYSPGNGAGGGGGAGGPGETGSGPKHGSGGPGKLSSISGTPTYYAGGGGGGGSFEVFAGGAGGIGGGGQGGFRIGQGGPTGNGVLQAAGTPGAPNTGGGGGAGGSTDNAPRGGGSGGSGIVIVRYPGPQKATGGNTITQIGGFTIHTFTSSGTFTTLGFPSNGASVYGLQNLVNPNSIAIARGGGITYTASTRSIRTPPNQTTSFVELPESILQSLPNGETWTMEFAATLLSNDGVDRYGPHMTTAGGNDFIFHWTPAGVVTVYGAGGISGSNPSYSLNTPALWTLSRNYSNWRLYKNGVFAAEYSWAMTGANNIRGWILDQEQDALKGGFDPGQNSNADWHYFAFYDRILSDSEVSQNFNALRGGLGI